MNDELKTALRHARFMGRTGKTVLPDEFSDMLVIPMTIRQRLDAIHQESYYKSWEERLALPSVVLDSKAFSAPHFDWIAKRLSSAFEITESAVKTWLFSHPEYSGSYAEVNTSSAVRKLLAEAVMTISKAVSEDGEADRCRPATLEA